MTTLPMKLLIVAHSPSPNVQALTDAVAAGAQDKQLAQVEVRVAKPLEADADSVLWANGVVLGTTENFGYMSGALKDFFERIYYPCLEETQGLPYALFVKAGQDGQGARTSVERIVTGLKWRAIQAPLIMTGDYRDEWRADCRELGATMAVGLEAGIY